MHLHWNHPVGCVTRCICAWAVMGRLAFTYILTRSWLVCLSAISSPIVRHITFTSHHPHTVATDAESPPGRTTPARSPAHAVNAPSTGALLKADLQLRSARRRPPAPAVSPPRPGEPAPRPRRTLLGRRRRRLARGGLVVVGHACPPCHAGGDASGRWGQGGWREDGELGQDLRYIILRGPVSMSQRRPRTARESTGGIHVSRSGTTEAGCFSSSVRFWMLDLLTGDSPGAGK
jgi:hypothetical protein